MTLDDLVQLVEKYPLALACVLGVPPLFSLALTALHGDGSGCRSGWKYVYTILVYAVCIPGIFACMLTGYLFLFRNENLLKLNVLVYLLPIVSMAVSLLLIRRNVSSFDDVPGFGRLSGLMVMLAISFGIAFALHRLHFGIVFFAPLAQLGILAAAVFGLLHWGANRFSGKKDTPATADI